jgi:hypothetical protein
MGLYQAGKYAAALPLAQQSLALREKTLGPNHLDVATSLNNLALLRYSQGRYADAEPLYKRSLAIREKALGSDHEDVATSLRYGIASRSARQRRCTSLSGGELVTTGDEAGCTGVEVCTGAAGDGLGAGFDGVKTEIPSGIAVLLNVRAGSAAGRIAAKHRRQPSALRINPRARPV